MQVDRRARAADGVATTVARRQVLVLPGDVLRDLVEEDVDAGVGRGRLGSHLARPRARDLHQRIFQLEPQALGYGGYGEEVRHP